MRSLLRLAVVLSPCLPVCLSPRAAAAQRADTTKLNPVVVTSERTGTAVNSSTAAVTRITADELRRTPHATVADLLKLAPGFSMVNADGFGFDPQLMVRGFYGGGEAEYVVVLVDGRVVNQVHTGTVAWDALPPLTSIAAIDVVRGGASALYGDAAIGGVINIITRRNSDDDKTSFRWLAGVGLFDLSRIDADVAGRVGSRTYGIGAGYDIWSGYRHHSGRRAFRAGGNIALIERPATRITLSMRTQHREFDDPGPLIDSLSFADVKSSDPIYRFDHTKEHAYTASLAASHDYTNRARLSGSLGADFRDGRAVRTLALAPGFGDTQWREFNHSRLTAGTQFEFADTPLPGRDQLTVGVELASASLGSTYFALVTGDRVDHQNSNGDHGEQLSDNDVDRRTAAAFTQFTLLPSDAVRVTLGARLDTYYDKSADTSSDHTAFSPKLGINVRLLRTDRISLNAYATTGRSFKAPTLDQLYDRRAIPVPFPPFALTTSNPDLEPQFGTNIEAGLYHTRTFGGSIAISATLSAYQMSMKDEIDFDVNTLHYVNIGRSKHSGIEAGLRLMGAANSSVFVNYTLQSAKSASGENSGKYLKAIPRHQVNAGASAERRGFALGAVISHAGKAFIDDANTTELPAHTTVDLQAALPLRGAQLFAEVHNAFDRNYNSSGFFDPSGSGQAYYYPSARRVIMGGVRATW